MDVGEGRLWSLGHQTMLKDVRRGLRIRRLGFESLRAPQRNALKLNGELHRDHRPSLRCDEPEAMLIYSMSVSVDGFLADREGRVRLDGP
jgi:hypothetical protein